MAGHQHSASAVLGGLGVEPLLAHRGAVGQVIWIADDDAARRVIAPSFSALLGMIAEALAGARPADEGAELSDEAFDRLLGVCP